MVGGVGLDIMLISRMAQSLKRQGFRERVFTDDEWEYICSAGSSAQSAAGIFAVKEAVLKALGTGLGVIALRDIEVTHTKKGAPCVRCPGHPEDITVSISHMGDIAAAVAIWEPTEEV